MIRLSSFERDDLYNYIENVSKLSPNESIKLIYYRLIYFLNSLCHFKPEWITEKKVYETLRRRITQVKPSSKLFRILKVSSEILVRQNKVDKILSKSDILDLINNIQNSPNKRKFLTSILKNFYTYGFTHNELLKIAQIAIDNNIPISTCFESLHLTSFQIYELVKTSISKTIDFLEAFELNIFKLNLLFNFVSNSVDIPNKIEILGKIENAIFEMAKKEADTDPDQTLKNIEKYKISNTLRNQLARICFLKTKNEFIRRLVNIEQLRQEDSQVDEQMLERTKFALLLMQSPAEFSRDFQRLNLGNYKIYEIIKFLAENNFEPLFKHLSSFYLSEFQLTEILTIFSQKHSTELLKYLPKFPLKEEQFFKIIKNYADYKITTFGFNPQILQLINPDKRFELAVLGSSQDPHFIMRFLKRFDLDKSQEQRVAKICIERDFTCLKVYLETEEGKKEVTQIQPLVKKILINKLLLLFPNNFNKLDESIVSVLKEKPLCELDKFYQEVLKYSTMDFSLDWIKEIPGVEKHSFLKLFIDEIKNEKKTLWLKNNFSYGCSY